VELFSGGYVGLKREWRNATPRFFGRRNVSLESFDDLD